MSRAKRICTLQYYGMFIAVEGDNVQLTDASAPFDCAGPPPNIHLNANDTVRGVYSNLDRYEELCTVLRFVKGLVASHRPLTFFPSRVSNDGCSNLLPEALHSNAVLMQSGLD